MDRVGGYAAYQALLAAPEREYDDVVLAMAGEVEGAKLRRLKRQGAAVQAEARARVRPKKGRRR